MPRETGKDELHSAISVSFIVVSQNIGVGCGNRVLWTILAVFTSYSSHLFYSTSFCSPFCYFSPPQWEDGRRLHAQLQPEQLPGEGPGRRRIRVQRKRQRRDPSRRPLRHQREAAEQQPPQSQQHDHRQQVLQQQQQRCHVQRLQGENRRDGGGGGGVLCLIILSKSSGTEGNRPIAVMGGRQVSHATLSMPCSVCLHTQFTCVRYELTWVFTTQFLMEHSLFEWFNNFSKIEKKIFAAL